MIINNTNTTTVAINKTFCYMCAMKHGQTDVWIMTIYVIIAVLILIGGVLYEGIN